MAADAATTGAVRVEEVRGRSTLTRCFARYPLKLIAPSKVGPASCDAVWLYALTYGGGIVSVSPSPSCPAAPSCLLALTVLLLVAPRPCQGDTISCTVSVGDGCTAAITTQASTKVCPFCCCRCPA
jgi:urease accessory protein